MAAMKPQPGSLKCYTFGGMYRDSADVKIGRSLAQACGQSFKVLPLTPDFFAQFPDLAAEAVRRTDGAMDVTGAAGLYLNRLARDIAPVRMTGNYGGEVLRRVRGLGEHSVIALLCRDHRGLVDALFAAGKIGAKALLMNTGFAKPQFAAVAVQMLVNLSVQNPLR